MYYVQLTVAPMTQGFRANLAPGSPDQNSVDLFKGLPGAESFLARQFQLKRRFELGSGVLPITAGEFYHAKVVAIGGMVRDLLNTVPQQRQRSPIIPLQVVDPCQGVADAG